MAMVFDEMFILGSLYISTHHNFQVEHNIINPTVALGIKNRKSCSAKFIMVGDT